MWCDLWHNTTSYIRKTGDRAPTEHLWPVMTTDLWSWICVLGSALCSVSCLLKGNKSTKNGLYKEQGVGTISKRRETKARGQAHRILPCSTVAAPHVLSVSGFCSWCCGRCFARLRQLQLHCDLKANKENMVVWGIRGTRGMIKCKDPLRYAPYDPVSMLHKIYISYGNCSIVLLILVLVLVAIEHSRGHHSLHHRLHCSPQHISLTGMASWQNLHTEEEEE